MVLASGREIELGDGRIAAAKRGEEWAWSQLYAELIGPITGYVRQRGASDPDDLASEVFLQLARDIDRFDGDWSSFRSWVFVIAHRRVIDDRRRRGRRPKLSIEHEKVNEPLGGDVETEAIASLDRENLESVLVDLTDSQREVLALRVIADLSIEETARTMGKRVGAIKALQRRALVTVREAIETGRVTL